MEQQQSLAAWSQVPTLPLKESIRDMIRLQRDYQLSDELFWEIFNARVLLNEQIDVNAFVQAIGHPHARA
ncbi:hypothetical protein DYU11_20330 [Fibrisoma montanum]|uniref:Nucleotidyl transferase AbiEii/AbiGii toxin family protein n=1 Tax=Fibrisoma montanum TaxID=2305895 RepID=A0A418M3V9_9BACT|nr:hypothetical protein [Fibrisoma montanum]RIV20399.1 hypothetical protein DYU11_20330 [Fibrisoma montanum]